MSAIGYPLLKNDAANPTVTNAGKVVVSVYAYVANRSFATPATAAESNAVWAGRTVTVEASTNGVNWTPITGLTGIGTDTILDDMAGNVYYRCVLATGANLTNLRADVVEVGNHMKVRAYA